MTMHWTKEEQETCLSKLSNNFIPHSFKEYEKTPEEKETIESMRILSNIALSPAESEVLTTKQSPPKL